MKKIFALLMAVVMAFGLFACTAPADSGYSDTPITVPPIVNETPERKNTDYYPLNTSVKLRVLFTEDGLGDTDASDLWEEVTGVELDNLKWTGTQLMTSLAAGDIPDAIVMPWNFEKSTVYEYGAAKKFLDFSKYLDKMPNLCALIRQYPEIMEVCSYPDGAMYSLPKVGWSNTYQSNLIYIREDLLADLGWSEAPATTDQFLQLIKEAQAKYSKTDPEFVAFIPQNSTYMKWNGMNTISSAFFPSFGELVETGLTINSDKEVVLGAATDQYKYYLEFMNQVWESGAFETQAYTLENAAGRATIQNGHCIVSTGTYAPVTATGGKNVVDVMDPLISKYYGTKQWMKTPMINYRGCVASAAAANDPEKLDVLLAWLDSFYATEENPLRVDKNGKADVWGYSITKGVLGENWTKDDVAGTWTSGASFSSYADALYSGNFVHIPTANLTVKGQGTNEHLLPYAKDVSNINSIVLSSSDQDDFSDLWGDLESYISEMHAKFITGDEDLETGWDAYLSQLDRLGLPEVLEIYTRAYEARK